MKLTPSQAATRLGKTRRQVIYMIKSDRLQAEKIGGRWFVDEADLPLEEPQQRAQDRKKRRLRAAVEDALGLDEESKRRYSLRDLKAFQIALPIYRQLVEKLGIEHGATGHLRQALDHLGLGCHRFDRQEKILAYRAARDAVSLSVCELVLVDHEESEAWIDAIEQDLMAALAGLLRRLEKRRRF
jgi:hypothetical protein